MALFALPAEKIRVVQMETGGGFGGKEEYPVDHRRPCGAAGVEVRAAGEARLRPRRGHGGDDQAPSVADAASDGGVARRPAARDGRRLRHRRRRVLHAVAGRAVARHDPRGRARTSVRTSACAAAPSRPTRRRTARSAASARRRASSRSSGTWTASPPRSGLTPDELRRRNFIAAGQTSAVGQVMREPIDMAALLDRALALADYHAKRARFERRQPGAARAQGHRLRGVHARRRLHRLGRGSPRVGRRRRSDRRRAACACCRRAPRSARAPTPSSRRSPPMRSGCRSRRSRSRSPTRPSCPNSGPTVASRTCMVVGKLVETAVARADEQSCERSGSPTGSAPRSFAAPAPTTPRSSVRCAPPPRTRRRPACAGTTRRIRATPTAPTPGRSTSPRCRSTRRPARRASTTSSRCRKSDA